MGSGRGVEGGAKCLKYCVFFFNAIFVFLGLGVLAVGIWAEVKLYEYVDAQVLKDYGVESASRILIAVGCIITVVAFFGCCGAWKESKCMLIIFFVLMLILFCLELAAAVLAYQNEEKVMSELNGYLDKKIAAYDPNDSSTKLMDTIQEKSKCCGSKGGYKDWQTNTKIPHKSVPESCCITKKPGCGILQVNSGTGIYTKGCAEKIKSQVTVNLIAVGAFAITILVVQLIGMILAIILVKRIGDNKGGAQITS